MFPLDDNENPYSLIKVYSSIDCQMLCVTFYNNIGLGKINNFSTQIQQVQKIQLNEERDYK
jgi:hypothetical protein